MKPITLILLACILLAPASCTSTSTSPAPLRGQARDLVVSEVARFDGASGPSALHAKAGTVHLAGGTRIEYDRSVLIGSQLTEDRGTAFQKFITRLREARGDFQPLHVRGDNVESILVNLDGQRIYITTLKW